MKNFDIFHGWLMRGLLRRLALFIVDFVEDFAQFLGLLDDVPDFLKVLGVGRLWNPQLDVPAFGIFLFQVLAKPLPLLLLSELRIVGEPELNGASEDVVGRQVAVGLGYDAPVDGAWCAAGRCAVVFHGLAHDAPFLTPQTFLNHSACVTGRL